MRRRRGNVALGSRGPAIAAAVALVSSLTLSLVACKKPTGESIDKTPPPAVALAADPVAIARGQALVETFQCNRCHADVSSTTPAETKDCVGCHRHISDGTGTFSTANPSDLAKWRPRVEGLGDAPSLAHERPRLRRAFVEQYLAKPHDLRPSLVPTMPRLALTSVQIHDIASYIAPEVEEVNQPTDGNAALGRRWLDEKGCGLCHRFSGVPPLLPSPVTVEQSPRLRERALALAPDLRFTRQRLTRARVVDWLRDPSAVMHGASMPKIPLTESEQKDIAAYVMTAELEPSRLPPKPAFERLPVLTRKVTYDEVDRRIFHRTCWHCHSEPDFAIGDGGPGNSGGFGFAPRGVNLTSYASITAGFLNDRGERESIFSNAAGGVPRMVQALVQRHAEEAGADTGPIRGMPLGLPPLAAEEIQLIESWIAQGRPR